MSAAAALDATHWRSVFDSCDAALLVVDSAGLVQEANPAALALFRFDRADMHTATAADFTWVQDLGIAGFPTLLAERNGQLALLTNGYQPLSELSPLLGRWLERAACA